MVLHVVCSQKNLPVRMHHANSTRRQLRGTMQKWKKFKKKKKIRKILCEFPQEKKTLYIVRHPEKIVFVYSCGICI